MYRIGCLLLLALLVGCGGSPPQTMRDPEPYGPVAKYVAVSAMAFSADGKQLLLGYTIAKSRHDHFPGDTKYLALFDIETCKEVREFKGHTAGVTYVACTPDGQHAVSASADGTIRVWKTATSDEVQKIVPGEVGRSVLAVLSPDGRFMLFRGKRNELRLWSVVPAKPLREFPPGSRLLEAIAFSPNGRLAISCGNSRVEDKDDAAKVWNLETGQLICTPDGFNSWDGLGRFPQTMRYWSFNGSIAKTASRSIWS